MTPTQCLLARKLLNWSVERLAGASAVGSHVVLAFERRGLAVRSYSQHANPEPIASMKNALEAAGVEFIDEGGGAVVRMQKSAE